MRLEHTIKDQPKVQSNLEADMSPSFNSLLFVVVLIIFLFGNHLYFIR